MAEKGAVSFNIHLTVCSRLQPNNHWYFGYTIIVMMLIIMIINTVPSDYTNYWFQ